MKDLSKISVVLPSLDPDEKLIAVIDGLLEYGFSDIILVNDGSKQENLHYFTDLAAQHPEIHLLHHEVNKGKGAALKNAFRYFLNNRPDGYGVVTVDGDNQHHPADTRACCEHMLETGHAVLGCRDFNQADVPARSSFGNKTTSLIFKIFVGMTISDTQTGLRAIGREDLEILTAVPGDRFEYETNMLLAMKENGIPYCLATGSAKTDVDFYMEHLNLSRWFSWDNMVYQDGTFPGKPAPDCYRLAAKRIGLSTAECLVFEDSMAGIRAAQSAGVGGVIAVYAERFSSPVSEDTPADAVYHDFTDWKAIIEKYGF